MERKFYWKHELPYVIIYWSMTFFSFFLGMILNLEKAKFHWYSLPFFGLFFLFIAYNRQQYIRFLEKEVKLSKGFFYKKTIELKDIHQVIIFNDHLVIHYKTTKLDCYFSKKTIQNVTNAFVDQLPEKVRFENAEEI